MATEDVTAEEAPPKQLSFKIKTSGEGAHNITMSETAQVIELKNLLAGESYENIPAARQRLIYSGRVMKDEEQLKTYKIKDGNTVHMVKSAASNVAQNPASTSTPTSGSTPRATGVPTNMAAGTANNPLAGLTGARYAGHMGLPGMDMFGADGGMGAPPSEDAMASMMEDPNMQQMLNEALNNPQMIEMMIQQTPGLQDNAQTREMLRSPEFRQMLTNPAAIRQAAQFGRMMRGGGGGNSAFPAPGVTDNTPGAPGSTPNANATPGANSNFNAPPFNPFAMFPPQNPGTGNPFASLFGPQATQGATPAQTPPAPNSAGGQGTPAANPSSPEPAANPFAALYGGAPGANNNTANPFAMPPGMPPITPEMMRQAMQMMGGQGGDFRDLFGGAGPGGVGGFGGAGSPQPAAPADTRPPEERYAEQLRQLNDMGFFDFDRNVEALRRSGGSVQGAIEQLLS